MFRFLYIPYINAYINLYCERNDTDYTLITCTRVSPYGDASVTAIMVENGEIQIWVDRKAKMGSLTLVWLPV